MSTVLDYVATIISIIGLIFLFWAVSRFIFRITDTLDKNEIGEPKIDKKPRTITPYIAINGEVRRLVPTITENGDVYLKLLCEDDEEEELMKLGGVK